MDAVAIGTWVIRTGTHGHLFNFSLQVDQWYRMPSKAKEEKGGDSVGGKNTASWTGERKKAVFEV